MVALAAILFAAGRALSVSQFAYVFVEVIIAAGIVMALIRICAADLVTFGVALFWLLVANQAATLIRQPTPELYWNGVACAVAAVGAGVLAARRLCR